VLFGDYNPAGRLPVTFYKSVDQLPPFTDYSMQGRTYRYFKGEPLYPFGYGLSYTRFAYSNLRVKSVKIGEPVKVTVDVTNVGERDGDEVVQLYLTDVAASAPVPIKTLVGFERISLRPREKRTVTFTITPRQMSLIDSNDKRVIEPGEFLITTGDLRARFMLSGKKPQIVAE
jgi:beta-glucosidase